jgi:polyphosphate kinase
MAVKEKNVFDVEGKQVTLDDLIKGYKKSKSNKQQRSKAELKRNDEQKLKPYQAELIKLQQYLEKTEQKNDYPF